ncbi:ATP-binding protein [Streptomyces sp. NPDC089424]|uniref:ATP-binding protein n=1 Tax=Streptomyces sp. NPDC089424 TaxID=3365917 RepID=UPI00381D594B
MTGQADEGNLHNDDPDALFPVSASDTGTSADSTAPDNEHLDPYIMRISRLTVDKLGIKMYDRVSAVLAELIANAYDADAESVTVTLPWGTFLAARPGDPQITGYEVTITDNGHGMTPEEVNRHYLTVGSDRRQRFNKDRSRDKDRPVMGRKGIGKLAPFGICNTVEVLTAGGEPTENGYRVAHLILSLPDILADTNDAYFPTPGDQNGTWSDSSGTTIKLRDFQRKRVPSGEELDRQLSARFGLSREDWNVRIVNSHPESAHESFSLGELNIDILEGTKVDISDRAVVTESGAMLPVKGWLAYSRRPYKDPAMAGVRIYARGKIVAQTRDFGIHSGFTGEFKIRSYLVGEIHAEWLDDHEDLIRSDRQDIIWSSELGEALSRWGQKAIKELAARGETAVSREAWQEFKEVSRLPERLEEAAPGDGKFQTSVTEAARLLVVNKDRESLSDPDHVERIVRLAWSIGPHKTLLDALHGVAETTDNTFDAVVGLFDKARVAEMYSLGQVAAERVAVVQRLQEFTSDGDTHEARLQKLIEQAPWLLAPEWTPLGMNETLQRVRESFGAWYKKKYGEEIVTTAINRANKRPDFVLLHEAGTLWIVEIKRMDYHLTDTEYERAFNYLVDLEEFLEKNPTIGAEFRYCRLTFVVDHVDKLKRTNLSSMDNDVRIDRRGWHEILNDTQRAHKDFLERVEDMKARGESYE